MQDQGIRDVDTFRHHKEGCLLCSVLKLRTFLQLKHISSCDWLNIELYIWFQYWNNRKHRQQTWYGHHGLGHAYNFDNAIVLTYLAIDLTNLGKKFFGHGWDILTSASMEGRVELNTSFISLVQIIHLWLCVSRQSICHSDITSSGLATKT